MWIRVKYLAIIRDLTPQVWKPNIYLRDRSDSRPLNGEGNVKKTTHGWWLVLLSLSGLMTAVGGRKENKSDVGMF